jgi:hypothetical protein
MASLDVITQDLTILTLGDWPLDNLENKSVSFLHVTDSSPELIECHIISIRLAIDL